MDIDKYLAKLIKSDIGWTFILFGIIFLCIVISSCLFDFLVMIFSWINIDGWSIKSIVRIGLISLWFLFFLIGSIFVID